MLALDTILNEHYKITYVLDQRPDSVIYRAIDQRQALRVLIAELPQPNEAALADVRMLADQIAAVQTPGLLTMRAAFAQGLTFYMVSDDPGGQDLDRFARDRGGPLPEPEVLGVVDRLLQAIDLLHDRSPALLLGDLRPSDLWSSPDGGLALAPFTLARHIGTEPSAYRAPELHDALSEPTTSSDIYALGAVLYQLLTGWPPPSAPQRQAGTPLNSPRVLNANVSSLAEQLVLRALELKPANRYQRAREMRSALETVRLMAGRTLGPAQPIDPRLPEMAQPGAAPARDQGGAGAPSPSAPVYGPPPPAPPLPQPQAGYPAQAQTSYAAPAPPAQRGGLRLSNGCLIAIVAALALMALVVCVVGLYVGYLVVNGSAGLPFLPPSGVAATSAPAAAATAPAAPSPSAPTTAPAGQAGATRLYTETSRLVEDNVGAATYSPAGDLIAVGLGSAVQLRSSESLEPRATLAGHAGEISALAFSPDGRLLASGAQDDNAIILWDVAAGSEVARLEGHTGWIRSLAFSPDGSLLASGSTDQTVRLWGVEAAEAALVLEGHSGFLGNVTFSPDGATLASASRDGTVRLWSVADGSPLSSFSYTAPTPTADGEPFWLTGLAYSPDGGQLAVGSISGSIYMLDARSGQLQRELQGHQGWVVIRGVAFSPDGDLLASASLDGTIRLWSPRTGASRGVLDQSGLRLLGLAWSPDGAQIATTSDSLGSLTIWDVQREEVVQSASLAQGVVTALSFNPGGEVLGTGGLNGSVILHLLADGRKITLSGGAPTTQYLGFISDTEIAAISDSGEVVLINLTGPGNNRQLDGLDGFALGLTISRDLRLLAAGNERGEVVLWDLSTLNRLRTLSGLSGPVFALAFNSDGSQIAAASNQPDDAPRVVVWDVQSGDRVTTYSGHSGPITTIEMPAGQEVVATASSDGSLKVWGAADGRELLSLSAPATEGWFSSFAHSPDGRLLVTGTLAGSLEFWDSRSGSTLGRLELGAGTILAMSFSPDGSRLAVSTRDGGVILLEPEA